MLSWATLGGAEVAGIADRTGSLTPGKKADIVILDGSAVNMAPIIDPVGAVVCTADISNVKTVLVDGEVLKEDFKLTASLDGPARRRGLSVTTCSRSSARQAGPGSHPALAAELHGALGQRAHVVLPEARLDGCGGGRSTRRRLIHHCADPLGQSEDEA